MGVWTAACFFCGLAPTFTTLMICRGFVGVGEASFVALAAPFIGEACCCGAWLHWQRNLLVRALVESACSFGKWRRSALDVSPCSVCASLRLSSLPLARAWQSSLASAPAIHQSECSPTQTCSQYWPWLHQAPSNDRAHLYSSRPGSRLGF